MRALLLFGLLALLLSGCQLVHIPPEQIDFATDPRILRGAWQGALYGESSEEITFELSATYLNPHTYVVSGTAEFAGEVYMLAGQARGGAFHRYVAPQTAPPPPPELEAELTDGETQWRLLVFWWSSDYSGVPMYQGTLQRRDDDALAYGLEMTPRP